MKGSAFVLLLAICDASLFLLVKSNPIIALAGHLILCALLLIFALCLKNIRSRKGVAPFLFLVLIICILAPFVGFIGAYMLMLSMEQKPVETITAAPLVAGNPLRDAGTANQTANHEEIEPVIQLLAKGRYEEVVSHIHLIQQQCSNQSVGLLRRIRDHSNAVASLHANSALSVMGDESETTLSKAQRAHKKYPEDAELSYQLGCALQHRANSGLVPADEKQSLLKSAIEQFESVSEDEAALTGVIECYLERLEPSLAKLSIDRLAEISCNQEQLENFRRQVWSQTGDWVALQNSFTNRGLPPQTGTSQRFWGNLAV